ncbi:MAG TPA: lantibiotic dehydratase [Puia sp.]|nr:lantibiotic dehydratase [Puia sp.]
MSFKFSGHLLYRMPSGTPEGYTDDIQVILEDRLFRAALFLASPSLYESLAKSAFCAKRISTKEQLSVRKYFNRFCFRPTPFGLFASVSLANWGERTNLVMNGLFKVFTEPDQAFVQALGNSLLQCELVNESTFIANRTLYRVMNEYRYVHSGLGDAGKLREHLLQSISYSALLKDIFRYCETGRSTRQITTYIERQAGVNAAAAADYCGFLTGSKLLIHKAGPVLTGQGYLKRLSGRIVPGRGREPSLRKFLGHFQYIEPFCPDQLSELRSEGKSLQGGETCGFNVTMCRVSEALTVDRNYQALIHDGLFALDALCPPERMPAMEQFISAWQKRFEGQTLPLLTVLDPDYGIGYFPATVDKQPVLLETLSVTSKREENEQLNWTAAHRVLLECWHNSTDPRVITISPEMLGGLQGGSKDPEMMGMSVLFRVAGEFLHMESAGGINAAALMGRFTIADGCIHEAAREIAAAQERVNPDIIFAEIAHLTNPKTDNVNRRENIWSWELPVTAAAGTCNVVRLSDLQVSVSSGKVIVWCKKNGKLLMPRLTSAYNHSIDKLPLFRFLADLPYQYGRTNLSFDLGAFFPGLSFYPRVVYKKTVLQLATWIINEDQLADVYSNCLLPPIFSLAEGDRQLVFRRDIPEDRLLFFQCVKNKRQVRLTEVLDKCLPGQFSCSVYSEQPINVPMVPGSQKTNDTMIRKFPPGSGWLYLKIYSTRLTADRILLRVLPILREKYPGGHIRQWFFIRYEDDAPHLRLRMLIAPKDTAVILETFKNCLNGYLQSNIICEYHVGVYNREIERYRAVGIELTECFFWKSSELVAGFLAKNKKDIPLEPYLFGLVSVRDIMSMFLTGREEMINFSLNCFQGFTPEFGGPATRVELNKKYRGLSYNISAALCDSGFYKRLGLSRTINNCLKSVSAMREALKSGQEVNHEFLASILHMHMNRIFPVDPRKQEMIIYYLLYKNLLSERARCTYSD